MGAAAFMLAIVLLASFIIRRRPNRNKNPVLVQNVYAMSTPGGALATHENGGALRNSRETAVA